MSIKSKAFAAAATLTLVGGVGAVGAFSAGAANAATPSCGDSCINIFSKVFTDSYFGAPSFVLDSLRQGSATGQPLVLFRSSQSDPAEDFTVADQDTVADMYAAGMVSPALALHYGCIPDADTGGNFPTCEGSPAANLEAFEFEYAPYGVDSGMCMGVGTTAAQGTKVALEGCGVSSKTVWIEDTRDAVTDDDGGGFRFGPHFTPLINGSDTNFSHPFVLTYPHNGYPTDTPRPQLTVTNLTGFSNGIPSSPEVGTVNDNQLWSANTGVLNP